MSQHDSSPSGNQRLQPHRGTVILVLGILGLVMCGPIGIIAWIMGKSDLDAMRRGVMDPSGQGMTNAGYILGIIATVLTLLGVAVVILAVLASVLLGR